MPSNSKVCHNCPACMKEFNRKLMPPLHLIKELNIVERHVVKYAKVKVQLVHFVRIILVRGSGKWK